MTKCFVELAVTQRSALTYSKNCQTFILVTDITYCVAVQVHRHMKHRNSNQLC